MWLCTLCKESNRIEVLQNVTETIANLAENRLCRVKIKKARGILVLGQLVSEETMPGVVLCNSTRALAFLSQTKMCRVEVLSTNTWHVVLQLMVSICTSGSNVSTQHNLMYTCVVYTCVEPVNSLN
jgi:hypothetical protein